MDDNAERSRILNKRISYEMPGTDAVVVQRDLEFRAADSSVLLMDLYSPPEAKRGVRVPAVVIVGGYRGPYKEMGWCLSWGRLLAASGLAAIAYTNRDPVADVDALFDHLSAHAASLGIDEKRIAILASSGCVPLALSLLMQGARSHLTCAALCYGFMLDTDGSTDVADAARLWGFANPCAGKSVQDLATQLPLFVVRCGQDQFGSLNRTMDRFIASALTANLPLTVVNLPDAPHAFDLFDETEPSRQAIRQLLAFMQCRLLGSPA